MHILRTIRETAGSFGKDAGGNFGIVFAVAASAILMSAGYGLNLTQLYHVKSDLGQALDSAVTSTARDLTTGVIAEEDARGMVEAFLTANSGSGFASAEKVSLDRLVVNRVKNTVEASASVDVALAFPLFGSADTRRVVVESAALYSDKQIEVAMMLDVTGSMGGRKIRDLRTAATNAVETLLKGQDERNPRIRVSLVPFANSVNAGDLADSSVFVERRWKDRDQAPANDDPVLAQGSNRRPDNCATERKGANQYDDAGPDVSMVNRDLLLTDYADWSNTRACPVAAVVPLTADMDHLLDTIDDLRAEGGTAGHIGVQWSWYMLSPEWKGVLGRTSEPTAYHGKKGAKKYAILMTDGEFNLSYSDVSQFSKVYDGRGKAAPRDAAKRLCAEMRGKGIEVFTIGFKLEERNARETMRDCASPDSSGVRHYFETENGDELDAAYQEIAANIERLALTK